MIRRRQRVTESPDGAVYKGLRLSYRDPDAITFGITNDEFLHRSNSSYPKWLDAIGNSRLNGLWTHFKILFQERHGDELRKAVLESDRATIERLVDLADEIAPEDWVISGRAWVREVGGSRILFASFWGFPNTPRITDCLMQLRKVVGQVDQVLIQTDDVSDGTWSPYAEPNRMVMSAEVRAEIRRLSVRLHTAPPEEKERILKRLRELKAGPSYGFGAGRYGDQAVKANFNSPAEMNFAMKQESVTSLVDKLLG